MAGKFMKTSGLAALAAGIALIAVPASAQEGRGRWGGGAEASAQRGGERAQRGGERAQRQAAQGQQSREASRPAWRAQSRTDGGDAARQARRAQRTQNDGAGRQGLAGSRNADGSFRWNAQRAPGNAAQAPAPRPEQPRASTWQRNRDYTDAQRNRSYRDGSRDRNWQERRADDGNRWQGDRDRRGDNRWTNNQNTRNWDRNWRRNNRYDWNGYRNSNRNVYRIGRYYAPYNNYGYRRLSIGFGLDSMFFGSRYWINDPWQYRLPSVYGPYRWVRYFDDVLLVDTYSGEVVDVIYDFFW